jgi:hypothetical protein
VSENIPSSDSTQQTVDPPISQRTEVKKPISKKAVAVFIIVSVAMLVMGVGAAAYTALVVNSPQRIWDQAMLNASEGYSELSQKIQEKPVAGGSVQGSFTSVAPIASTAVVNGKWHDNSAELKGDIGVAGVEVNGEMRVVGSDTSKESDIYIKIDNLSTAESVLRFVQPELAELIPVVDGVWYLIDEPVPSSLMTEENNTMTGLSPEELSIVLEKLNGVIEGRVFTSDESKAVFIVNNPVGREEFEGVDTYKYDVIIQKQQFIDFAGELSAATEGTALQNSTKSINELTESLQEVDFSDIRAEAWVDIEMKYFRNVRLTLPDSYADGRGYIEFGLDYEGDDELPFRIRVVTESKTNSGDTLNLLLRSILNKKSTDMKLSFTISGSIDSQQIAASGELLVVPSEEAFEIEAPDNAKKISELVGLLMDGGLFTLPEEELDKTDINSYRLDDVEV